MFGNKRRRAASTSSNPKKPANGSNVSASAATAASQAFLRSETSNASLAASAAGAALRSRPTTPISVADVQTKRTMRRASSISSVGSTTSEAGRGPPSQLVRRGSSGSMTERTFRDPSPNRASAPVPSAPNAPPVPAIPRSIQNGQYTMAKSHRRATSMEAPAMRVASPPPNKANGRGSSLQPAGQTARRNNQRSSGLPSVQELTGIERPASRGSVNFSLPTSARPMSPVGQKRLTSPSPSRPNHARIVSPTNHNLIYDPNTRSFLPEAELLAIEQRIQDASNRTVKQKKRTPVAAGSHLSEGTAGGRPRGTAIDAMEVAAAKPAPVELPAPVPVQTAAPIIPAPARKKKKKVVMSDTESDAGSYMPNSSDNDSDVTPSKFNTRAGQMLAKKPSVVREDREQEEKLDDTPVKSLKGFLAEASPASNRTTSPSPSPLPRSVAGRGHGRGQASSSAAYAQARQQGRSASHPPPQFADSIIDGSNGTGLVAKPSARGGRVQSVSPARTTHFASTTEGLTVRHDPPARSISPRKSALKHFNPPRGPSPIEGGNYQESEASAASEELSVPKKRGNRVSFDESHVVVGQAASPVVTDSPVVLSPQNKRSWYSIGRGKKKAVSMVDDDEIMQPRPVLPSFGSVRERKPSREIAEERQLVKPSEPISSKPPEVVLSLPSPPIFTSPTGETFEYPLGQSNDHIVGALISQDANAKNEANTSKSREPLPPTVTSVEGNGYHSESEGSLYDDSKADSAINRMNSVRRGPDDANAETYQALASPVHDLDTPVEEKSEHIANGTVPKIAVLAATPTLEGSDAKREWPEMPGGWGSSTDESSFQEGDETRNTTADPTPATVGIAEPPLMPVAAAVPTTPVAKSAPISAPILEEYEESDTSIYSDAAEELSDNEGFMSLNAVADSPVAKTFPMNALALSTPDSPKTKMTKERAYQKSQLSRTDSEPDVNAGWDKVQSYWSTLSADRKKQLELEARQEDEGSETETEAKAVPQPRKVVALPPPALKKTSPAPKQQRPREVRINSDRQYMIQPGVKAGLNGHAPPMKSSMRSEPASNGHASPMKSSMRSDPVSTSGDTHIRKSMRGDDAARNSLRAEEPRGSLQKKHRPMSLPVEVKSDPDEVRKHIKALSIASAKLAPSAAQKDMSKQTPGLRRRGSGDSDSSFKRARASSDGPTFRRSMRGSTDQGSRAQSPVQSSRFSLRTLSPAGSEMRRPFSGANAPPLPSNQAHMRASMRNSMDSPSLRSTPAPRMGGKGFGGGAKKGKGNTPRSSRFADSSDEEDERPSFKSRYDSSDDDEPRAMTGMPKTMRSSAPARATPRRRDSSDLSTDDEGPVSSGVKLMKKPPQNGKAVQTNQGSSIAAGSLRRSGSGRETIAIPPIPASAMSTPQRPQHTRRGSIMSILRRKKPDNESKVRKSDAESAARRDTPLERSRSDLAAVRAGGEPPKLQKRGSSNGWPLAEGKVVVGGEDGRPSTADVGEAGNGVDGEIAGERPGVSRRFTATGMQGADVGANGGVVGGKKKKKFGALRRMFKLDD